MGWKIIEIEDSQSLHLFLNNLVIFKDDIKITIPICDIDVLLINNYKLKITIQLINALCNANVLTIICDNYHLPSANILPIIGNFNTLKIVENQINWSHHFKADLWLQIIKNKIYNQQELTKMLFKNDELYKQFDLLIKDIKAYDISNREGHASKIYWHALYGLDFKRHNDDYCNKLLNYGYTILRSYVTRSIIKKGLDPRISIFHKSFHNYFALASDLMEPFRILIDFEVYKIMQTKEVNFYEHKTRLIECFNNKIFINQTKQFVNNGIDIFIDAIIKQNKLPLVELDYGNL